MASTATASKAAATSSSNSQHTNLELLDERLTELETRLRGYADNNQQTTTTANVATVGARVADLTAKVALYTTGRRNINRAYTQLQQLEQALQASMKPGGYNNSSSLSAEISALRTHCEVILMEEQQLQTAVENLKAMAQLQSVVLNSKPISNTIDYAERINRISAKQQEQTAKVDDLLAKTHAIVIAYNKMISELGSWASVWCESDN